MCMCVYVCVYIYIYIYYTYVAYSSSIRAERLILEESDGHEQDDVRVRVVQRHLGADKWGQH